VIRDIVGDAGINMTRNNGGMSGAFATGSNKSGGNFVGWGTGAKLDFAASRVVPTGPEFSSRTLSAQVWRRVS